MSLRQNILATLAYYDVFDFPLTADEVFKFLIFFKHLGVVETKQPNTQEVKKELDQLLLDRVVDSRDGLYFLFDKEYLVPLRHKREKIALNKWQRAVSALKWLRLTPFVRAIFASGSLAMSNTDELSDLDVLVVTRQGRIWLTRFLITLTLSILGVRRRGFDRVAPDKICLNHYITDHSLHIPFQSLYNAQTYSNLVPIFLRDGSLVAKFKQENRWVMDYVFDWANIDLENKYKIKTEPAIFWAKFFEVILSGKAGDFFERLARKYQFRRIAENPVTEKPHGRIVFNDQQLEFHPHSIETEVVAKYNQKLARLGLAELAVESDSGLT